MHLMKTLGQDMSQLAGSVMPIISNITSGAKLLVAWGKVGLAKYREYDASTHSHVLMPGEMAAAFKALNELLERNVTSETVQASIQTADFTARTAASFVDFGAVSGTMIGVVSTLGKLVHKLYLLGREYSESRAANRLLGNPKNLSYRMFQTYPLLGCYMLVCSDLSEIIALSRVEQLERGIPFGAAGWMDDVEYIKKTHVDPLLERATSVIYKSPFVIPNMPLHALYKPTFLDKAEQKAGKLIFMKNVAKIGLAIGGA